MKNKYLSATVKTVIYTAGFVIASFIGIASPVLAASSQLYLSPSSRSVVIGGTLSVGVRVNTGGDTVNAVQANLSYPADKLDFLSISASGSAFEIQAENSGGGGNVRIARGTLSGAAGDKLVATVNFRAKTDNGSAAISFAGGSSVVRSSDNQNTLAGTPGGNYTFVKPAPVVPKAPAPPPPPPDTVAPVISDAKVESIGFHTATITWTTNEPSTSSIDYGPSDKYGVLAQTDGLATTHKVVIASQLLVPGVTYHFRVKSNDAANNTVAGNDTTFKTTGYKVEITVTDQHKKPLKGVQVTLLGVNHTTDKNGLAVFDNTQPGQLPVKLKSGNKTTETSVNVADTAKDEQPQPSQKFTLQVEAGSSNPLIWLVLLILLLLLGGGGIAFWLFKRRHKRVPASAADSESPKIFIGGQGTEPPIVSPLPSGSDSVIIHPTQPVEDVSDPEPTIQFPSTPQ